MKTLTKKMTNPKPNITGPATDPTQKLEQSGVHQKHLTGYVGGTENNEHTLPTNNPDQNYMHMTPLGVNRQVPEI